MKVEILKLAVNEVANECHSLCSTKHPSVLRKCNTDDIVELSLEKICKELEERAPFLYSILMTVGIPSRSVKKDIQWLPSVAAASSILLKERCRTMNGFQILFTVCMKHTGFRAMSNIMSSLKVGVSSTYYNKKCNGYGSGFDANLKKVKKEDELVLSHGRAKNVTEPDGHTMENRTPSLSSGYKFPFDNFDIFQKVHDMTEDNQNKDIHWVNHNAVKNRVSGNHLPDDVPTCDLAELSNVKLLPNSMDHVIQMTNYVELVERVLTEEIPYLAFCKDIVRKHIPHPHSKEMAEKTEKVGQ